jgi:hypothetical protein
METNREQEYLINQWLDESDIEEDDGLAEEEAL